MRGTTVSTHETDQLDATSSELGLKLGESTKLSSADRGEVILTRDDG